MELTFSKEEREYLRELKSKCQKLDMPVLKLGIFAFLPVLATWIIAMGVIATGEAPICLFVRRFFFSNPGDASVFPILSRLAFFIAPSLLTFVLGYRRASLMSRVRRDKADVLLSTDRALTFLKQYVAWESDLTLASTWAEWALERSRELHKRASRENLDETTKILGPPRSLDEGARRQ